MQRHCAAIATSHLNDFMANDDPVPNLSHGLGVIANMVRTRKKRIAAPDAEMLITAISGASAEIDYHFPADEDRADILDGLEAAARLVRAHSEEGSHVHWGPLDSLDGLWWREDRAKLRIAQNITHSESLRGEIRKHREKRRSLLCQWREGVTQ